MTRLSIRIHLQNVMGIYNLIRAIYPTNEIIDEQEMPALIFWVSIRHFNFLEQLFGNRDSSVGIAAGSRVQPEFDSWKVSSLQACSGSHQTSYRIRTRDSS
jgi:hypothetical protein